MQKVVIIHGTKGSPDINWFPWLARELTSYGMQVTVPRMPTPEGQTLNNWLDAFENQVGVVDNESMLIGHSAGALFLLRFLERHSTAVGVTILVSGFTGTLGIPEYDALNSSFVKGNYDWDKIRRNAGKILCLSGDDDPYVPLQQGLDIAAHLNSNPIIVSGGGHLNGESGFHSFPLLLQKISDFVKAAEKVSK